jgi:hypothetical protein
LSVSGPSPAVRLRQQEKALQDLRARYADLQKANFQLGSAMAALTIGSGQDLMPSLEPSCVGSVELVRDEGDGRYSVQGWAVDKNTRRAVTVVVLVIDDTPVAAAAPAAMRQDIVRTGVSNDPKVGFTISVQGMSSRPLNRQTSRVVAFTDINIGDLAWTC